MHSFILSLPLLKGIYFHQITLLGQFIKPPCGLAKNFFVLVYVPLRILPVENIQRFTPFLCNLLEQLLFTLVSPFRFIWGFDINKRIRYSMIYMTFTGIGSIKTKSM